jgi:hypothetical protein
LGLAHLLTRGERESHCGCGPFVDLLMSPWSEQRSLKSKIKQNLAVMLQISQLEKNKKTLYIKIIIIIKEGMAAYSQEVQGK